MHIIKAKICGHQIIKNSGWFEFSPHLTIFSGPCGSGKTPLFRILQSINPHPLQQLDNPFANFPDYFFTKGYKRKINPRKKTAALAIFEGNNEIRGKLAEIEPILIETDKIEVGRRLDWSRWISFVEIASSPRWSEIADAVAGLNHSIADQSVASALKTQFHHLTHLAATDRIKGKTMHLLGNWLTAIQPHLTEKEIDLFNKTLHSVYRCQRIQTAKEVVSTRLPSFLYLTPKLLLNSPLSVSRLLAQQQHPPSTINGSSDYCLAHQLIDHDSSIPPERITHFLEALNEKVQGLSPAPTARVTHTLDGDTLTFYQKSTRGRKLPLSQAGSSWRWLVTICLFLQASLQNTTPEPILLLDEPEKGLNHASLQEFKRLIYRLSRQTTIIWATGSSRNLQTADRDTVRLLIPGTPETGTTIRPLLEATELDKLLENSN